MIIRFLFLSGSPYYKCGCVYIYRKNSGDGWAMGTRLGSDQYVMYSRDRPGSMSITDPYTTWAALASPHIPGRSPQFMLAGHLRIHCFPGAPEAGFCKPSFPATRYTLGEEVSL